LGESAVGDSGAEDRRTTEDATRADDGYARADERRRGGSVANLKEVIETRKKPDYLFIQEKHNFPIVL
jgi:hypothetical protein